MASRNLQYKSEEIRVFYERNRINWKEFYDSERYVLSHALIDDKESVLDIGCGCGGLGLALRDQFGIQEYTGIEICEDAAAAGNRLNPDARIFVGDVLGFSPSSLGHFDIVVSLSCIDWNMEPDAMLRKAWSFVGKGGQLVVSVRLSNEEGISEIRHSYQHINFQGKKRGEIAPYVVFNGKHWLDTVKQLPDIDCIYARGYWGKPSVTAVTPFKRLCFGVFALRKGMTSSKEVRLDVNLPVTTT